MNKKYIARTTTDRVARIAKHHNLDAKIVADILWEGIALGQGMDSATAYETSKVLYGIIN